MKLLLRIGSILFLLGITAYVCAFKVSDLDFWWHVKAGEIMLQTRSLISVEPFAYTRIGAPYLARHEWLAQIFLALIFHIGGSWGVILFRMFIAAMVALVLLLIDRRSIGMNALLIALAIPLALPGFRERPQLFTLLFFTVFLVMLMRWMDRGPPRREGIFLLYGEGVLLLCMQILWVNTHGAAALLGLVLFLCFVVQEAVEGFLHEGGAALRRSAFLWLGGLGAVSIALLLSPNGVENIHYLSSLLSDRTTQFIREWQPRVFLEYLKDFWWLWGAVIASVACTRRKIVFSILTLLFMGYLSREAIRHEVLFVITAIAVILYQLKWNEWWKKLLQKVESNVRLTMTLLIPLLIVCTLIIWHAHVRAQDFAYVHHLRGLGTFEPLAGAYDFLEKNGVGGSMFNTYGDGGYLLYRGYPNRKIFIDGRNVDYGLAFLARTFDAAMNEERWKELEQEFNFTYAVIGYDAILPPEGPLPYTAHLDKDPRWHLVYLDDWAAIYVKDVLENQKVIAEHGYTLLTPGGFAFGSVLRDVKQAQLPELEKELQRLIQNDPRGIKGLLLLARLYLFSAYHADAIALANEAKRRSPHDFEPYYVLAMVAAKRGDWETSAQFFDEAIKCGQYGDLEIDMKTLDEIYRRAGRKMSP